MSKALILKMGSWNESNQATAVHYFLAFLIRINFILINLHKILTIFSILASPIQYLSKIFIEFMWRFWFNKMEISMVWSIYLLWLVEVESSSPLLYVAGDYACLGLGRFSYEQRNTIQPRDRSNRRQYVNICIKYVTLLV